MESRADVSALDLQKSACDCPVTFHVTLADGFDLGAMEAAAKVQARQKAAVEDLHVSSVEATVAGAAIADAKAPDKKKARKAEETAAKAEAARLVASSALMVSSSYVLPAESLVLSSMGELLFAFIAGAFLASKVQRALL